MLRFLRREAEPPHAAVLAESWLVINPSRAPVYTGVVSSGESEWLLSVPAKSVSEARETHRSASLKFLWGTQSTVVPADTAVLVGPRVQPYIVCFPPETLLFGIVIRPWALGGLLDDRADRAFNQFLLDHPLRPPDELVRRAADRLEVDALHRILIELQRWFVGKARHRHSASVSVARQVVSALDEASGGCSLASVAAQVERSHSILCRGFKEHVGMTAKRYARIRRANATLRALDSAGRYNGADTAIRFGYFDQPHMIRELREITGSSPQVWRAARERLKSIWPSGAWEYLGFEPPCGPCRNR